MRLPRGVDPTASAPAVAAALFPAKLRRLVKSAGELLLAPKAAEAGEWRNEGHRSPAAWMAAISGTGLGEAISNLETGERLETLDATRDALRRGAGRCRRPAIAAAVAVAILVLEGELLAVAEFGSMRRLKDYRRRFTQQWDMPADENAHYAAVHARPVLPPLDHLRRCLQGRVCRRRTGALFCARSTPAPTSCSTRPVRTMSARPRRPTPPTRSSTWSRVQHHRRTVAVAPMRSCTSVWTAPPCAVVTWPGARCARSPASVLSPSARSGPCFPRPSSRCSSPTGSISPRCATGRVDFAHLRSANRGTRRDVRGPWLRRGHRPRD